jgi:hypothetical protein
LSEGFLNGMIYFLSAPSQPVTLGISMDKEQITRPVLYSRRYSIDEAAWRFS